MFRKRLELDVEFQKLFKTISKREILKNPVIRQRLLHLKLKLLSLGYGPPPIPMSLGRGVINVD